jgi:hypothetical protein
MNINKKNKGLTFLETIASVAIILIVSSFLFYKIIDYNEKKDLQISRHLIQNIFMKYTNKSFYQKIRYLLEIDLKNKILIIKNQNNEVIEEINLPLKLKYEIPYENVRNPYFKVETTKTGNLSKAFTFYIFGYKEQVENRIAFYTFQKEKILKLNVYLNQSVKNIYYKNIIEYHYSQNGQNRIGWVEEE